MPRERRKARGKKGKVITAGVLAALVGSLVDERGEPVVGAKIAGTWVDDGDSPPVFTDDRGAFSIKMSHVEPGSHLIVATYAGTAPGKMS